MSNKFVRVVAIVLAVLMAGGVFAAVLQVFAVSPEAAAVAATGQRSYWPVIVALIAAVVLIVLCIIIPKVSKKNKCSAENAYQVVKGAAAKCFAFCSVPF